jgi:hypothetical protein
MWEEKKWSDRHSDEDHITDIETVLGKGRITPDIALEIGDRDPWRKKCTKEDSIHQEDHTTRDRELARTDIDPWEEQKNLCF